MGCPKRRPIGLWLSVGAFTAAEYRDHSLLIACYQGFARRLTREVGQMDSLPSQNETRSRRGLVSFWVRIRGFGPPSGSRPASAPLRQHGALPERKKREWSPATGLNPSSGARTKPSQTLRLRGFFDVGASSASMARIHIRYTSRQLKGRRGPPEPTGIWFLSDPVDWKPQEVC